MICLALKYYCKEKKPNIFPFELEYFLYFKYRYSSNGDQYSVKMVTTIEPP